MIDIDYIDSGEDVEYSELAYELVNKSGIDILSDNKLFIVSKYNEMVVGALFVNNDSDHFSFNVVTHPDYKRQGIAKLLSKAAMSEYNDRKDTYGDDYHLMVNSVNDMFAIFLVNEYDLNVYSKYSRRILLTDKEVDRTW